MPQRPTFETPPGVTDCTQSDVSPPGHVVPETSVMGWLPAALAMVLIMGALLVLATPTSASAQNLSELNISVGSPPQFASDVTVSEMSANADREIPVAIQVTLAEAAGEGGEDIVVTITPAQNVPPGGVRYLVFRLPSTNLQTPLPQRTITVLQDQTVATVEVYVRLDREDAFIGFSDPREDRGDQTIEFSHGTMEARRAAMLTVADDDLTRTLSFRDTNGDPITTSSEEGERVYPAVTLSRVSALEFVVQYELTGLSSETMSGELTIPAGMASVGDQEGVVPDNRVHGLGLMLSLSEQGSTRTPVMLVVMDNDDPPYVVLEVDPAIVYEDPAAMQSRSSTLTAKLVCGAPGTPEAAQACFSSMPTMFSGLTASGLAVTADDYVIGAVEDATIAACTGFESECSSSVGIGTFTAVDDSLYEGGDGASETATVSATASNAGGLSNTTPSRNIMIVDNDNTPPSVSLSVDPSSVTELSGAGRPADIPVTVTAVLSARSGIAATVPIAVDASNLTPGTGGHSIAPTEGTITINAGAMEGDARFTLTVSGNDVDQDDETIDFSLDTDNLEHATPGSRSSATLTITDDDPAPQLAVMLDPTRVTEGDSVTLTVTGTLNRGTSRGEVIANINHTILGSHATLTLRIPRTTDLSAPMTTGEVATSFNTVDNRIDQDDERLLLQALAASGSADVNIVTPMSFFTIEDNDDPPLIKLAPLSPIDEGEMATVTASLVCSTDESMSCYSGTQIVIQLTANLGSGAIAGDVAFPGGDSITIAACNNSGCPSEGTATVEARDNTVFDGAKVFMVEGTASEGVASDSAPVTLTVRDNDSEPYVGGVRLTLPAMQAGDITQVGTPPDPIYAITEGPTTSRVVTVTVSLFAAADASGEAIASGRASTIPLTVAPMLATLRGRAVSDTELSITIPACMRSEGTGNCDSASATSGTATFTLTIPDDNSFTTGGDAGGDHVTVTLAASGSVNVQRATSDNMARINILDDEIPTEILLSFPDGDSICERPASDRVVTCQTDAPGQGGFFSNEATIRLGLAEDLRASDTRIAIIVNPSTAAGSYRLADLFVTIPKCETSTGCTHSADTTITVVSDKVHLPTNRVLIISGLLLDNADTFARDISDELPLTILEADIPTVRLIAPADLSVGGRGQVSAELTGDIISNIVSEITLGVVGGAVTLGGASSIIILAGQRQSSGDLPLLAGNAAGSATLTPASNMMLTFDPSSLTISVADATRSMSTIALTGGGTTIDEGGSSTLELSLDITSAAETVIRLSTSPNDVIRFVDGYGVTVPDSGPDDGQPSVTIPADSLGPVKVGFMALMTDGNMNDQDVRIGGSVTTNSARVADPANFVLTVVDNDQQRIQLVATNIRGTNDNPREDDGRFFVMAAASLPLPSEVSIELTAVSATANPTMISFPASATSTDRSTVNWSLDAAAPDSVMITGRAAGFTIAPLTVSIEDVPLVISVASSKSDILDTGTNEQKRTSIEVCLNRVSGHTTQFTLASASDPPQEDALLTPSGGLTTLPGTLSINADQRCATTIMLTASEDVMGDVRVTISIGSVSNSGEAVAIESGEVVVTIRDVAGPPALLLTLDKTSIGEGESATLTAELTHVTGSDTNTVSLAAIPSARVTLEPSSVTLGSSDTSATVTVRSVGNDVYEGGAVTPVSISATPQASGGGILELATPVSPAILTITDNDPQPTATLEFQGEGSDTTSTEGGTVPDVVATISSQSSVELSFPVTVDCPEGAHNSDFVLDPTGGALGCTTGSAQFVFMAGGSTTSSLSVQLGDNTVGEADKEIKICLGDSVRRNCSLEAARALTLTINDNDEPQISSLSLASGDFFIPEGGSPVSNIFLEGSGSLTFTVTATINNPSTENITIMITVPAGDGYTGGATKDISFGGCTRRDDGNCPADTALSAGVDFTINVGEDDDDNENETITLTVSPTNATLMGSVPVLTIADNDRLVDLIVVPITANEDEQTLVMVPATAREDEPTRVTVTATVCAEKQAGSTNGRSDKSCNPIDSATQLLPITVPVFVPFGETDIRQNLRGAILETIVISPQSNFAGGLGVVVEALNVRDDATEIAKITLAVGGDLSNAVSDTFSSFELGVAESNIPIAGFVTEYRNEDATERLANNCESGQTSCLHEDSGSITLRVYATIRRASAAEVQISLEPTDFVGITNFFDVITIDSEGRKTLSGSIRIVSGQTTGHIDFKVRPIDDNVRRDDTFTFTVASTAGAELPAGVSPPSFTVRDNDPPLAVTISLSENVLFERSGEGRPNSTVVTLATNRISDGATTVTVAVAAAGDIDFRCAVYGKEENDESGCNETRLRLVIPAGETMVQAGPGEIPFEFKVVNDNMRNAGGMSTIRFSAQVENPMEEMVAVPDDATLTIDDDETSVALLLLESTPQPASRDVSEDREVVEIHEPESGDVEVVLFARFGEASDEQAMVTLEYDPPVADVDFYTSDSDNNVLTVPACSTESNCMRSNAITLTFEGDELRDPTRTVIVRFSSSSAGLSRTSYEIKVTDSADPASITLSFSREELVEGGGDSAVTQITGRFNTISLVDQEVRLNYVYDPLATSSLYSHKPDEDTPLTVPACRPEDLSANEDCPSSNVVTLEASENNNLRDPRKPDGSTRTVTITPGDVEGITFRPQSQEISVSDDEPPLQVTLVFAGTTLAEGDSDSSIEATVRLNRVSDAMTQVTVGAVPEERTVNIIGSGGTATTSVGPEGFVCQNSAGVEIDPCEVSIDSGKDSGSSFTIKAVDNNVYELPPAGGGARALLGAFEITDIVNNMEEGFKSGDSKSSRAMGAMYSTNEGATTDNRTYGINIGDDEPDEPPLVRLRLSQQKDGSDPQNILVVNEGESLYFVASLVYSSGPARVSGAVRVDIGDILDDLVDQSPDPTVAIKPRKEMAVSEVFRLGDVDTDIRVAITVKEACAASGASCGDASSTQLMMEPGSLFLTIRDNPAITATLSIDEVRSRVDVKFSRASDRDEVRVQVRFFDSAVARQVVCTMGGNRLDNGMTGDARDDNCAAFDIVLAAPTPPQCVSPADADCIKSFTIAGDGNERFDPQEDRLVITAMGFRNKVSTSEVEVSYIPLTGLTLNLPADSTPSSITLSSKVGSNTVVSIDEGREVELTADIAPPSSLETNVVLRVRGDLSLYRLGSQTLTIIPGQPSASVTLAAVDDGVFQPGGRSVLIISGEASDAANTNFLVCSSRTDPSDPCSSLTLSIEDNDLPRVSLVLGESRLVERSSTTLRAELSVQSLQATVVTVSISRGGEFLTMSGGSTLTIPARSSQSTGALTITAGEFDPPGRVAVITGRTTEGNAADPEPVAVNLLEDVSPTILSVVAASPNVMENAGEAILRLEISGDPLVTPLAVSYRIEPGSAATPEDYIFLPSSLGECSVDSSSGRGSCDLQRASRRVSVGLVDDMTIENNETFSIVLDAPRRIGVELGAGRATVTIIDDDLMAEQERRTLESTDAAMVYTAQQIGIVSELVLGGGDLGHSISTPVGGTFTASLLDRRPQNPLDVLSGTSLQWSNGAPGEDSEINVWLRGSYRQAEGTSRHDVGYDSLSYGFGLGSEYRGLMGGQLALGLSISYLNSQTDYTSPATAGNNNVAASGRYLNDLYALSAHGSFKVADRTEIWAILGVGFGELEDKRTSRSAAGDDTSRGMGDTTLLALGSGARHDADLLIGQIPFEVEVSGSLRGIYSRIGDMSYSGEQTIDITVPASDFTTLELRMGTQMGMPIVSDGFTVTPFVGMDTVQNLGDYHLQDRHALDLVAGVEGSSGRLVGSLEFSTELTRSSESSWGVRTGLQYSHLPDGSGLSLSVSNLRVSSSQLGSGLTTRDYGMSLESGYGFLTGGWLSGSITPYVGWSFAPQRVTYAGGLRFDSHPLRFELGGEQRVPTAGTREDILGLDVNLRF